MKWRWNRDANAGLYCTETYSIAAPWMLHSKLITQECCSGNIFDRFLSFVYSTLYTIGDGGAWYPSAGNELLENRRSTELYSLIIGSQTSHSPLGARINRYEELMVLHDASHDSGKKSRNILDDSRIFLGLGTAKNKRVKIWHDNNSIFGHLKCRKDAVVENYMCRLLESPTTWLGSFYANFWSHASSAF